MTSADRVRCLQSAAPTASQKVRRSGSSQGGVVTYVAALSHRLCPVPVSIAQRPVCTLFAEDVIQRISAAGAIRPLFRHVVEHTASHSAQLLDSQFLLRGCDS
jgi:hypothetical protein